MRFQVPNQSRNFRNHSLHRRLERGVRWREVLFSAQKAGYVNDGDLSHASAVAGIGAAPGGVIAAPDAYAAVTGPSQGSDSVSDCGRDGEAPQRRLPKAKVGHFIRQQSHCHAMERWACRTRDRDSQRGKEGEDVSGEIGRLDREDRFWTLKGDDLNSEGRW